MPVYVAVPTVAPESELVAVGKWRPQQAMSESTPLTAVPCESQVGVAVPNVVLQVPPVTQLAVTAGVGSQLGLPVMLAHMADDV